MTSRRRHASDRVDLMRIAENESLRHRDRAPTGNGTRSETKKGGANHARTGPHLTVACRQTARPRAKRCMRTYEHDSLATRKKWIDQELTCQRRRRRVSFGQCIWQPSSNVASREHRAVVRRRVDVDVVVAYSSSAAGVIIRCMVPPTHPQSQLIYFARDRSALLAVGREWEQWDVGGGG